jgi:hypothetical protein
MIRGNYDTHQISCCTIDDGWGFALGLLLSKGFLPDALKYRASSNLILHQKKKYSNKMYYCFDANLEV